MRTRVAAGVVVALASGLALAQVPGRFSAPRDVVLLTSCGTDVELANPIPPRWDAVVLAGDGRLYSPCPNGNHQERHREVREAVLLSTTAVSRDPELRRLTALAFGRLVRPDTVMQFLSNRAPVPQTLIPQAFLAQLLRDPVPSVRFAAATAIADALSGMAVEPDTAPPQVAAAEQRDRGRILLEAALIAESEPVIAAAMLESLGRLKYADDRERDDMERVLLKHSTGPPLKVLGAMKALEALIRGNPRRAIQPDTRDRIQQLALVGPRSTPVPTLGGIGSAPKPGDEDTFARVRVLAMLTLQQLRDPNAGVLEQGAMDAEWQVRRIVAQQLDLNRPELAAIAEILANDPAPQVRYELVGAMSRYASRTKSCAQLLPATKDTSPMVALRAIDVLPSGCPEAEDVIARLDEVTEQFSSPRLEQWQMPAHALVTLGRFAPAKANLIIRTLTRHAVWQVRAYAARAAGNTGYALAADVMAQDPVPNVRTAALEALAQMKSDLLFDRAIAALAIDDYQLNFTAANLLKGAPEDKRDQAVSALLTALRRLTASITDASRDPRVAIVERLAELMTSDRAVELKLFADDFDPHVVKAVNDAFRTLGLTSAPLFSTPRYRYPLQPLVADLQRLPRGATIQMAGGATIEMVMLIDQAPVTIARFASLVRAGYYNGLTFHRVVPNFVIQGGSPGASEYESRERFWRDETGSAPHVRGAVGVSTRGHDTGDGQIFIDLVDVPRLDHDYTVFARIVAGLDVVDRILEGAKIDMITLR